MKNYESLVLRKGIVIDIDDPDKKGKIKIRVLPDLKNVNDNLLPWFSPFISRNSTSIMSNDLLEVGSKVRVLIRKDYQRGYYLSNMYFYGLFNFDTISKKLSSSGLINNIDYKNLVFRLYLDGGLEFHNNSTGEHGYIHKSGSIYFIDKDGYYHSKDFKSNEIVTSSTGIDLNDANGNTISMKSSYVLINNNLKVLQ
jgi:hypothetical protein